MQCTASVGLLASLIEQGAIPPEESSRFAAEGTVAHSVREDALRSGSDAHDYIGEKREADGFTFTVTHEMADFLQPGIEWIREHTFAADVEIRVDLGPWLPGQFGTCDTGWVSGNTLFVSDLKYGAGVPVDAVGNRQIRLYALGYWHYLGRPKVDRIVLNIDQPRAGGMKFWEIAMAELLAFGEEAHAAYEAIESGKVTFAPGEKACKWCQVKDAPGGCAARDQWMLSMFADAFDDPEDEVPSFPDPGTIDPAQRYHIVKHSKLAIAWLAEMHERCLAAALAGNPDPGSKAVDGDRGNRTFVDPGQAGFLLDCALGDDAYKPRQLIGIPDAEKLLKPGKRKPGNPDAWEAISALIYQPDGRPIVVPEDDPRPMRVSAQDTFDETPDFEE